MSTNNTVDTAKKGQTTNKIQSENKSTEARKKAREEQYTNFRIGALRRRCKRMNMSEEKTEEYVNKLKELLKAPKKYSILVMLKPGDGRIFGETIKNAKIDYKFCSTNTSKKSSEFFWIEGDQTILAKIREIAPPGARVHPYAKKLESVIPREEYKNVKKPTNNTAEAKAKAKTARKEFNKKRGVHKKHKGKAVVKCKKRKTLLELKKIRKATTVQLSVKKSSTGSKKASNTIRKAA